MFRINTNNFVDKKMAQLIRESTNKSIKKRKRVDFTSAQDPDPDPESQPFNNMFLLLPFVSIFSFLAGYYCKRISSS